MDNHVRILGWLFVVYHAIGIVVGLVIFFFLAGIGILSGEVEAVGVLTMIGLAISMMLIVLSAPGIIAGVGLLAGKAWGRILAIVLAIFHLVEFPIGTLFGGYALWVLFHPDAQGEFR